MHQGGSKVVCAAPTSVSRRAEHRSICQGREKILDELAAREEEYRAIGLFELEQDAFLLLSGPLDRIIAGKNFMCCCRQPGATRPAGAGSASCMRPPRPRLSTTSTASVSYSYSVRSGPVGRRARRRRRRRQGRLGPEE